MNNYRDLVIQRSATRMRSPQYSLLPALGSLPESREMKKRGRKSFKPGVKKKLRVWNKTEGRCWYCGVSVSLDQMCIDHADPMVKGGSNADSNLLPSCRRCNALKHRKTVEESREWLYWQDVNVEPFKPSQIAYLNWHGITLPSPQMCVFWGEIGSDHGQ